MTLDQTLEKVADALVALAWALRSLRETHRASQTLQRWQWLGRPSQNRESRLAVKSETK